MLTVACVYWKGEFRGREKIYTSGWVEKLSNMVARNLNIPHRFVCLTNTDIPLDIEKIPLTQDWPGWWSKIELFRPGLFDDRVLYLDLDTVILKDLDAFVQHPHDFGIIGTGNSMRIEEGKRIIQKYNSSVMVFDPGRANKVYTTFEECPKWWMDDFRGDQDFIGHIFRDIKPFPVEWSIKLRDWQKDTLPGKAKVLLCMNGKLGKNNKAVDLYPWIKELWI